MWVLRGLSLVVLALSCAQVPKKVENRPKPKKTNSIVNVQLHPGGVARLSFPGTPRKGGRLSCAGRALPHHWNGRKAYAYLAESYFSKRSSYKCVYGKKVVARVKIKDKKFPEEKLRVNPKRVRLSKKDYARVLRERSLLGKLYSSSASFPRFEKSFKSPLSSVITSIYGTRRTFNNVRRSQHLGTDFRAGVGTPIRSSNAGKVVFAGSLFYTGKTVILDHGVGIFTNYGHLSKLKVKTGESVGKDQLLGLSGMSGRVTGPHLHWGVKVNGHYIDGTELVEVTRNIN